MYKLRIEFLTVKSFAVYKAAQLLERVEPCCQKLRYQMKTSFFPRRLFQF